MAVGGRKGALLHGLVRLLRQRDKFGENLRLLRGEILRFAGIRGQVIESPGVGPGRFHSAPVTLPDRRPAADFPVEILVLLLLVAGGLFADQLRYQTDSVDIGWSLRAGDLGDGGQHVGEVTEVIGDAARPPPFNRTDV